jgi:nucleoid DNA-binding protein
MSKQILIDAIDTAIENKKKSNELVDIFLNTIKKVTLETGKLTVRNFGKFYKVLLKGKNCINPHTMQKMKSKDKTEIKFKQS